MLPFPFLFPSYCHSVVHRVVSLVSDGCNQSSMVFFLSSSRCIDASTLSLMQASPLLPSFLDGYGLSTTFLGGNALCMIMSLLVLWSVCLSYSVFLFKKVPEYLMRCTAQVFILLISFLLDSFVSSSFLVLLGYSF